MHLDLGAVVAAEKIMRHGLNPLHLSQGTLGRIPGEHIHDPAHFAELISELA